VIVGYHLTIGAYGFWLPNDPRGSWSSFVGAYELYLAAGRAIKTDERRSLARNVHDRDLRRAGKQNLQREPLKFNGIQARAIARGFERYFARTRREVWACAIMPDHVHLVVGRSRISIEQLSIQLKAAGTRQMTLEGCHPCGSAPDARGRFPKCFVRGEWSVFLEEDAVDRTIQYVKNNPIRQGYKRQKWSFVRPRSL